MTKYSRELAHSRLYAIWNGIKGRCYVKSQGEYKRYGARGIKMCDEWHYDFMQFYNWSINNGYNEKLSIDRIDYNGDYEPSNCRWVSIKVQQNNRRDNVFLTYNDETHTIAEWSEITGLNQCTIQYRKYKGWSDEKTLTTPLRKSDVSPIIFMNDIPKEKWVIIGDRKYYNEGNGYLFREDFSGCIHTLGLKTVQKAIKKYPKIYKARIICQRLARIVKYKQLKEKEEK